MTTRTLTAVVFDHNRIGEHLWVGASGPDINLGWRTTRPPARGTTVTVTINEGETE